jgi:nicotinamide mononucleotide (NMN) deamidase PncC
MSLCCDVLQALRGKTLATAESLTGGGIGAALTAVSGSSAYTHCFNNNFLSIDFPFPDI